MCACRANEAVCDQVIMCACRANEAVCDQVGFRSIRRWFWRLAIGFSREWVWTEVALNPPTLPEPERTTLCE
jgi:hypothetical protein